MKKKVSNERLNEIRSAKEYLIANIDAVTKTMVAESTHQAKNSFQEKRYSDALEEYEKLSKYLSWGSNISSIISADDCIRYGICCLLAGLRIRHSKSYLFSYGYGGRWVDSNWIDCADHHVFPTDWSTVEGNIENMISTHPLIEEGLSRGCSNNLLNQFTSIKRNILLDSKKEYCEQEFLKSRILSNPTLLSYYIGKKQGFFIVNNQLFYIYDDGNDNLYPIYKVAIVGERMIMTFVKFSHFRKKRSGKVQKYREFTIKIITNDFLQLDCSKGNVPIGQCQILHEESPIDYTKYFYKNRFGRCRICGGKSVFCICFNLCWSHIE